MDFWALTLGGSREALCLHSHLQLSRFRVKGRVSHIHIPNILPDVVLITIGWGLGQGRLGP